MRPAPLLLATTLTAGASWAAAAEPPTVMTLDGDPVVRLLAPDAIPAIDNPRFVSARRARFMADDEPVLGVYHQGEARAYSLWHLDRHEIVNDTLGGSAIAVTW
jgi:hypothetical protein